MLMRERETDSNIFAGRGLVTWLRSEVTSMPRSSMVLLKTSLSSFTYMMRYIKMKLLID